MNWRSLLGVDLAGKLSNLKRFYKGDWRKFDHRAVWCQISQWGPDKWRVSANSYCSDPAATGLDSHLPFLLLTNFFIPCRGGSAR
jgi:hypothetical protein